MTTDQLHYQKHIPCGFYNLFVLVKRCFSQLAAIGFIHFAAAISDYCYARLVGLDYRLSRTSINL